MQPQPTIEDARQSLSAHVATKGEEIREKFGPRIGWRELQLILQDRASVRYPCAIEFDSSLLEPEEFAFVRAHSDNPEDGFTIYVHPYFSLQLERATFAVLYQLVVVNYGIFASAEDAETFGASILGLSKDGYYEALCQMSDEIA